MVDPELQRWADQRMQELTDEGRIIGAVLLHALMFLLLNHVF